jgi:LPXTG-motif cell wall-anchored protein
LEKANAELSARLSDRDKARKEYIAAIAEAAVTQNRKTAISTEPVYHPGIKASAGKFSTGKVSTGKVSTSVTGKAHSEPEIRNIEPVETGDSSDMMAQLAMLLASAGVMTVTLKKKKENL